MNTKALFLTATLAHVVKADTGTAADDVAPQYRVTVMYKGPGQPVYLAGPFDLSPDVQQALRSRFVQLAEMAPGAVPGAVHGWGWVDVTPTAAPATETVEPPPLL